VFSPKLLAARTVIDACTRDELAGIVAHERGHLHAMDNLKRWLMACAPDILRWTPMHHAMLAAWCDAAEDAADDAATAGEEAARLNLAALLVKVARLTPHTPWTAVTVSPFVNADGLDRRVRRLLQSRPRPASSPWAGVLPIAAAGLVVSVVAALNSPAALEGIYELVEALIAFAR
jgi:beta-lactamase regulating signal transducer with metallopeptidase domain